MDYTYDREERVEMLILIVEDEAAIARFLERGLNAHGHRVVCAYDGEEGTRLAVDEPVELVLLDISLPRLDGRDVLRRIRLRRSDLPVLMLTARDDTRNKVDALDAGADDYLTKPFVFEELLARVRALTRRSGQAESAQIQTDGLTIDLLSRHAWRGDQRIELSSREFALLEYLMRHSGQVLSRQQILSAIWDYDFEPVSNVVDVYVRHLRNKVDPPDGPSLIQTVRGAGYRLTPRQPPSHTTRLQERFKMKEISSRFHRSFTDGVYNLCMWAAGGDQHSEHLVTAAGSRPLRGPGGGDSSFPYFFPSHLRPRTPIRRDCHPGGLIKPQVRAIPGGEGDRGCRFW